MVTTSRPTSSVRRSRHAPARPAPAASGAAAPVSSSNRGSGTGRKARVAAAAHSAPRTATTGRWTRTGRWRPAAAAPPRAPTTVPRLKPAWKRGMTGRPSSCSTAAPSTFMATSQIPESSPSPNRAGTRVSSDGARPAPARQTPQPRAAMPTVRDGPSRCTTTPASGRPATAPTAPAPRRSPSLAGSSPRAARIPGRRAQSVATIMPFAMKTTATAVRARTTRPGGTVGCAGIAVRTTPVRGVVRPPSTPRSGQADDGLRPAEHPLAGAGRREIDADGAVRLVLHGDDAGHLEDGATCRRPVAVGHHDRLGEADAVLDDGAGVACPVGHEARRGGHGQHAVRDDVGQADGGRDPLVPVDDVEVTAGAGIADEVETGQRERRGRQFVADRDLVERADSHHSPPLTTIVESAVAT